MYANVYAIFIANHLSTSCINKKKIETIFSEKVGFKFKSKIRKIFLSTDKSP